MLEISLGLLFQVAEKLIGLLAGMSHALFENEIREILIAEQIGFFATQPKNLAYQGTIVKLAGRGSRVRSVPKLLANGAVVEVRHSGRVAWSL